MCSEEASNLAGGTCVYRDLSCNNSNAQITGEKEILSGTSMCLEETSNLAGGTCVYRYLGYDNNNAEIAEKTRYRVVLMSLLGV